MVTEQQRQRFSAALLRLAGDEELLVEMAGMVIDDAPELMNEIHADLGTTDKAIHLDSVAANAHKLKGMFSTFETGEPVSGLEELIHHARAGHAEAARSTFASCEPKLQHLMAEIKSLGKNVDSRY